MVESIHNLHPQTDFEKLMVSESINRQLKKICETQKLILDDQEHQLTTLKKRVIELEHIIPVMKASFKANLKQQKEFYRKENAMINVNINFRNQINSIVRAVTAENLTPEHAITKLKQFINNYKSLKS